MEDFSFLLPHYLNLIETAKNISFPKEEGWKIDADRLAVKYGANLLSIADLLEYTKPKVSNFNTIINFIDYHSIYAIARSALETYLTLHYLYADKVADEQEKKFRHSLWSISSLSNRQRLTTFSEVMKDALTSEKKQLEDYILKLKESKFYISTSISTRTKNRIEKGITTRLDWKPDGGWSKLANKADYNSKFFDDSYNLLSAVCHSDQIVVNYIDNFKGAETHIGLTKTAMSILNVITSDFLHDYVEIYPISKNYLNNHLDLIQKIEILRYLHSDAYSTTQLEQI